jgi:hypothetical protein
MYFHNRNETKCHTTKGISEVKHNAQGWEANIHHKSYIHTTFTHIETPALCWIMGLCSGIGTRCHTTRYLLTSAVGDKKYPPHYPVTVIESYSEMSICTLHARESAKWHLLSKIGNTWPTDSSPSSRAPPLKAWITARTCDQVLISVAWKMKFQRLCLVTVNAEENGIQSDARIFWHLLSATENIRFFVLSLLSYAKHWWR